MKMLFLCTLSFASLAFAESEFQFPAEFSIKGQDVRRALQKSIPSLIGSGGELAPRWQINEPYKTEISDIRWNGQVQISWEESSNPAVRFTGVIKDPVIEVASVTVRDTIRRRVGGVDVTVRVDAQCGPIRLRSLHDFGIAGELGWTVESSSLKTHLKSLDFSDLSQWQVEIGSCQGPRGVEEVLTQAFKDFMSDEEKLNDLMFGEISKFVQEKTKNLENALYESLDFEVFEGVKIKWQTMELLGHENGDIKLFGLASLIHGASQVKMDAIPYVAQKDFGLVRTQSGLILSRKSMSPILNFLKETGLLNIKMSSKSISGLSWLLSSRFIQFFVWPDLWNFPRNVELLLKGQLKGSAQVQNVQRIRGGAALGLKSQATVGIEAPFKNRWVPYLDLQTHLDGDLEIQTYQDRIRMNFSTSKLPLNFLWRKEFSQLRRVTQWLSTHLIGSRVLSAVQEFNYEMEKKTWNLGEVLPVELSGVSTEGKDLILQIHPN